MTNDLRQTAIQAGVRNLILSYYKKSHLKRVVTLQRKIRDCSQSTTVKDRNVKVEYFLRPEMKILCISSALITSRLEFHS